MGKTSPKKLAGSSLWDDKLGYTQTEGAMHAIEIQCMLDFRLTLASIRGL